MDARKDPAGRCRRGRHRARRAPRARAPRWSGSASRACGRTRASRASRRRSSRRPASGSACSTSSRRSARRADCFYVYPTVSDQPRPQATQVVDDVLRSVALQQTARYSRDCRVFAPVYRQVTIQGLLNPSTVTPEMRGQGYADVVEAWRTYLRKYNHGRGVIFVGHSQGSFVLRKLIAQEVDGKPAVAEAPGVRDPARRERHREEGQRSRRRLQAHPRVPVPAPARVRDRVLGLQRARRRRTACSAGPRPGLEVLCTNPAALGGGAAKLSPVYSTKPFAPSVIGAEANVAVATLPHPKTPWATVPNGVTGRCSHAGGATCSA